MYHTNPQRSSDDSVEQWNFGKIGRSGQYVRLETGMSTIRRLKTTFPRVVNECLPGVSGLRLHTI